MSQQYPAAHRQRPETPVTWLALGHTYNKVKTFESLTLLFSTVEPLPVSPYMVSGALELKLQLCITAWVLEHNLDPLKLLGPERRTSHKC